MGHDPNDDFVTPRIGTGEGTSRRAFLGTVGKAATAVTVGGLASGVSSAMFGAPAYASSTTNVPPYATLAPNGGDCTAALNQFVAGVVTTAGAPVILLFPQHQQYQVDGTVLFQGKSDLTVNFNGSTLWTSITAPYGTNYQANRTRAHTRFTDCQNLNINNLNVFGPKPSDQGYNAAYEAQHGIELESCTTVSINTYYPQAIWGDGLYVASNGTIGQSSGIEMLTFGIDQTGRHGTAVTNGNQINIHNGTYTNIGRTVLDLEPNSGTDQILGIQLHDSSITTHALGFVSSVGTGTVDGVTVSNVSAAGSGVGCSFGAVPGAVRKNIVLSNLTSDTQVGNPFGSAFCFVSCQNVALWNISQPLEALAIPMPRMKIARFWNCTTPYTLNGVQMMYEPPPPFTPPAC